MLRMTNRRPHHQEAPFGLPTIEHRPGLADETLRELAPLLAEDGIDLDNLEATDMPSLQRAMDRAVERRNMQLFTPVGPTRAIAVTTLRLIVTAILDGDEAVARGVLSTVQPEAPDNSVATVSSCIGIALGLLDDWMTGQDDEAPAGLRQRAALPAGRWAGQRAATDILVLAVKGRAFRSLDTLLVRRGGLDVLAGAALALAAGVGGWARLTQTPVADVASSAIR